MINLIKRRLRKKAHAKLSQITSKERGAKSRIIQSKLFALKQFKRSKGVCFYIALQEEVDTLPMIRHCLRVGKRVFAPFIKTENKELELYEIRNLSKDVKKGVYGILCPDPRKTQAVSDETVDCVVVPGLLFDSGGYRLGRGGGYYDRLLRRLGSRVFSIGLAFSCQLMARVPREMHDHAVDAVLTEME